MTEADLRERVIATALAMNGAGINRGKSGNVSVRWRTDGFDGFLVTPSALPYAETTPQDIVAVTLAEMYWRALQVGEPVILPDEEMQVVLAKFVDYGKP